MTASAGGVNSVVFVNNPLSCRSGVVFQSENNQVAHDIRLAGPWEYSTQADESWVRCQLPWSVSAAVPTAVIRRKFHRPSGLSESSVLEIVLLASSAVQSINLNGNPISRSSATSKAAHESKGTENRFDVTGSLQEFNTVDLELNGVDGIELTGALLRIIE